MPQDIVLGAKQLKNPKGIKPRLDSEVSPKRKPATSGYVDMNIRNYHEGDAKMIARPANESEITEPEPKQHPMEELFGRGIKRSNGPTVPKDHPAIQETEN